MKFELLTKQEQWYSYEPPPVLENEHTKLLWNFYIQTDHQITHNKSDIVLHNKDENYLLIIDMAIPSDYNVVTKRAEKLRNYTELGCRIKKTMAYTKCIYYPIYNRNNWNNTQPILQRYRTYTDQHRYKRIPENCDIGVSKHCTIVLSKCELIIICNNPRRT